MDIYTKHAGTFDGEMAIYYGSWACMRPFSAIEARIVDGLWQKAENAAATDAQLANIRRSELSWRWWKASAGKCEFSFFSPRRADEKEKLYKDILDSGAIDFAEFSGEDVTAIDREVINWRRSSRRCSG